MAEQVKNNENNELEVKHLRNMLIYGLIFAVLFFAGGIGLAAILKIAGVQELLSSSLFNTMGYKTTAQVLQASGLNDFGMAGIIKWALTAIGFTVGALIGWKKQ